MSTFHDTTFQSETRKLFFDLFHFFESEKNKRGKSLEVDDVDRARTLFFLLLISFLASLALFTSFV